MKKLIFLTVLVLLLTGCGKSEPVKSAGHFAVRRDAMEITLNAPAKPVLDALGAPFGYSENCSNLYSGVERTYRFSGMNLRTYSGEDGERILGLLITDKSIPTEEGITIGDTAEQVRACYGEDAIANNCCIVSRSNETMTLLLQNNVVTVIQYSML